MYTSARSPRLSCSVPSVPLVVQSCRSDPAAAQALPGSSSRPSWATSRSRSTASTPRSPPPTSSATWISGFYRFGRFHRTVRADNQPDSKVKIAVVQAGTRLAPGEGLPADPLERTSVTKLSASRRHHLDGARRARHRDVRLLHLHRGPALARLRRQAEPRRPGLRRVRPGDAGDGRGAEDPAAPAEGQTLTPAVRILNDRAEARPDAAATGPSSP